MNDYVGTIMVQFKDFVVSNLYRVRLYRETLLFYEKEKIDELWSTKWKQFRYLKLKFHQKNIKILPKLHVSKKFGDWIKHWKLDCL